MEIIEKEHRQPTFNDAINYGMRLQKQKEQKSADIDLDTLVIELEETIGTSPHSRETIKEFFQKALKFLRPQPKAEWSEDWREEDIQTRFAFYTYKDDPSVLYLSNVFVEESSRNHGFGTRILKAAEKVAEAIGATTISLKVKQDSPANAWYRKHGYGYVAFEDGYDWLEKNLEYMKPNQAAEWSEEEKAIVGCIAVCLDGQFVTEAARKQCLEWFNRHRRDFLNRPSWKPSEEQGWIMIPPDATIEGIDSLLKQVRKKLQQEPFEVNYKVEERKWVYNAVDNIFPEDGDFMSEVDFRKILKDTAHHFYQLGLNTKKEE